MDTISDIVDFSIRHRRSTLDLSNVLTDKGHFSSGSGFDEISSQQIHDLSQLTEVLKLRSNALTILPAFVFRLSKLRQLWLNKNRFRELAWRDLAALERLEMIVLDENQIQRLPDDLSGFHRLRQLSLQENPIEDISSLAQLPELRVLNIRITGVKEIPIEVIELARLVQIKMENPMLERIAGVSVDEIPHDIQLHASNAERIREYIRHTSGEFSVEDVRAAKILFLGNTQVGKSTLIQNLTGGVLATGIDPGRTPSVARSTFHKKNSIVNIWDLGGEERHRDVQQFFYSKNAVYVLVTSLPMQKSRPDWFPDRYWFELVNHVVGVDRESSDIQWIVVVNHFHDRMATHEDRAAIDALRSMFPLDTQVIEMSLFESNGLKKKIAELEAALLTAVGRLQHAESESGRDVVRLSNTLMESRQKIVSRTLVSEIVANELDVALSDNALEEMVRRLDEDGFILDLNARDIHSRMIALDANEFVRELKTLFDAATMSGGRLSGSEWADLSESWSNSHRFRPMLEELEFCIRVSGHFTGYVVPVALASIIDEGRERIATGLERWKALSKDHKEVVIECRFSPVIPIGVFHRIACDCYSMHADQIHHYREEFVLELTDVVISASLDLDRDMIVIRSIGRQAFGRLDSILSQLDSRVAYYNQERDVRRSRIDSQRKFVCNCSGCLGSDNPHRYDWDAMVGKNRVVICPNSLARVGAPEVVHGVRKPIVFIAYDSSDFDRANHIERELKDHGIDVLRYTDKAEPGSELESNSTLWTEESDLTLFLVSHESLTSQWCAWELALRLDQGRKEDLMLVASERDLAFLKSDTLDEMLQRRIGARQHVAEDALARFELWRTRQLWGFVLNRMEERVFIDAGAELILKDGVRKLAAKLWQARG